MEPDVESLRAKFRDHSTLALRFLNDEGAMEPGALAVLREELARRDVEPDASILAVRGALEPASGTPDDGIGVPLAGRGRRLVARMIDVSIAGFICIGPLRALRGPLGDSGAGLSLVVVLLSINYALFGDAFPGEKSIGKRLLAIRVVDERTGAACSRWQTFVRNLLLVVAPILDAAFIFGERRQRLGDMFAGTIVEDTSSSPW